MMFGLSVAPRRFTKLMKEPIRIIRFCNIRIVIYIDDMLLMGSSIQEILTARDSVLYLIAALGLTINWDKSVLEPTQSIVFLGILLETTNLTFRIPPSKIQTLKTLCKTTDKEEHITTRKLASIMGSLMAISPAFTPAPIHLRSLQHY